MFLKKLFFSIFLALLLSLLFSSAVFAVQFGILPSAPECTDEAGTPAESCVQKCEKAVFDLYAKDPDKRFEGVEGYTLENVLGCAVKYGYVKFWMLPFFITSILEFLVALAGMVCMLFIVVGGYHYVAGGLTYEKEKGKKTLMYAIIGFIVVLISWIVINIVQTKLTS